MSVVTDSILLYPLANNEESFLLGVNKFFDKGGFVHADAPGSWYGGTKALQANVAIGAFNHMHAPSLIEHIGNLPRGDVGWCQLVLQGEWNYGFELVNVFRDEDACAYPPGFKNDTN